ncbi:MAG: hypothetical protein Q9167_003902 [Letrouitia subvulpina]
MATPPLTRSTIGIISIGEMGLGIAKLLQAHEYRVVTTVSNRSPTTQSRAASASIETFPSIDDLVLQTDYLLSIVPPHSALSTASSIASSSAVASRSHPLHYVDLNAISPCSARNVSSLFAQTANIRFVDGGIIGPPPSLSPPSQAGKWSKPSIPTSGPYPLPDHLSETLNSFRLSDTVGAASGLKMCFASLTKGLAAIAVQSFSTAAQLGVLPELQRHLGSYSPKTLELAEKGVVGCQGKAGRWAGEMKEINECFEEAGGEEGEMFKGAAEVFFKVAEAVNERAEEGTGMGATAVDVAEMMAEGARRKR